MFIVLEFDHLFFRDVFFLADILDCLYNPSSTHTTFQNSDQLSFSVVTGKGKKFLFEPLFQHRLKSHWNVHYMSVLVVNPLDIHS